MKHWLAYKVENNRVVWMRVIHSDERPEDVTILNNSFNNESGGMHLIAHYFSVTDEGFLTIKPERAQTHVRFVDRMKLAYAIEPTLLWLVAGAYGLIGLLIVALLLHLLGVNLG